MNGASWRLPADYAPRGDNPLFLDTPSDVTYQPHVYELATYLAKRSGARTIIDIGCGNGNKLRAFENAHLNIICVDAAPALEIARGYLKKPTFIAADLEHGVPPLPREALDDAIVICADVIEHLRSPDRLAAALGEIARACRYLLISTPDRTLARGLLDQGPPLNEAHTMEWSADELGRFLCDRGLPTGFFIGHTINTDRHRVKSTILVIAGREARRPEPAPAPRVAAVIHTYNERDIIGEVIDHLLQQGVEPHIFDNWSSDGSWEYLQSRKDIRSGRFPEAPADQYQWHAQLTHTAQYAATLDVDWIMHHDADEIRSSPWQGVTIAEAIGHADALGYNAIDFTVIDFRFLHTEPDTVAPFQQNLRFFEFGRRAGHFEQVKGWKNTGTPVDLASTGGHDAAFTGRRVFPLKFLMKHYPLRSAQQAQQKIFAHRLPRSDTEKFRFGWHTQYDRFRAAAVSGWHRYKLLPWSAPVFAQEYLVERLSGIGLEEREQLVDFTPASCRPRPRSSTPRRHHRPASGGHQPFASVPGSGTSVNGGPGATPDQV